MEPTEQLAIIIPVLNTIVDRLGSEQLDNPTACANLDVQGVLDHMMGGAAAFAPAFRGDASHEAALPEGSSGSAVVGQVPAADFRRAMNGLLAAVNAPGAMERVIDAPFGQVPGSVFARFVAFDGLIHGWDLASATGQTYDPPRAVVAAVDAFAREALGPDMRDGDTFAVEKTAPAGASLLEALVTFSGRTI